MEKDLTQRPYEFDFVQAVRLIYSMLEPEGRHKRFVGYDNAPDREAIEFSAAVELRHCSSDVRAIKRLGPNRFAMEVSFLGLVGASGILPYHYTRMLRLRLKENDSALRDFLDLFQHRIASNFFRASTKYRLPIQYELFSRSRHAFDDLITRCLANAAGFRHPAVRSRKRLDRLFLYYAGHFSHERPTMTGLVRMLQEVTGLPVEMRQFQFEWLHLDAADQSRLAGQYSRLGVNTVVGSRVPSIQNRFRIRLGALTWAQFMRFLPNQRDLRDIADFTRTYVGLGLFFDFQLILYGDEVKCAQLGNQETGMLGWTTWSLSKPFRENVEDAVFELDTSTSEERNLGNRNGTS